MYSKAKLCRADFVFENRWQEEVHRGPGTLHMQQFQISYCEDCSVWLFDSAACVYIDQCKFCTIFIAACQASVFVRNCTFLTVYCITQQFRVRDSFHCDFSICCQTQPIIESSSNLIFRCFPNYGYMQLRRQVKACKLNCWNNNWHDIYDYTPPNNARNYTLCPKHSQTYLTKIKEAAQYCGLKQVRSLVPNCIGKHEEQGQVIVLALDSKMEPSFNLALPFYQSRISFLPRNILIKFGMEVPPENAKMELLFVKINLSNEQEWIRESQPKAVIRETERLVEIEGVVFVPFKDEH